MKALRIVIIALVAWGCATNPATGRRQLILMSEQEEVQIGTAESDAEIRKQMGVYDDPELQQYVSRDRRRAWRRRSASAESAVDRSRSSTRRRSTRLRCRAGSSTSRAASCRSCATRPSWPACSDTKSVTSTRATRPRRIPSSSLAGVAACALAGILAPSTQAFQGRQARVSRFCSSSTAARPSSSPIGSASATRPTTGWDPRGVQGMLGTLARLDEAQGSRRGVPNWALTHPPAEDRVVQVQEAIAAARRAATSDEQRRVRASSRRPRLSATAARRASSAAASSSIRSSASRCAFPKAGRSSTAPSRWWRRPPSRRTVAMVLEFAPSARAVRSSRPRGRRWRRPGWRQTGGQRTESTGLKRTSAPTKARAGRHRMTVQAAHMRAGNQMFIVARDRGASGVPARHRARSRTRSSRSERSASRRPIAFSPTGSISTSCGRATPGSRLPNRAAVGRSRHQRSPS